VRIQGALFIAAAIAACARPFDETPAGTAPAVTAAEAGVDAPPDAGGLPFTVCPGGYSGLCAMVPMPLDWANPDGKKVDVLVDKISSTPRPKAQLWLLQGGPGGTAADMIGLASLFNEEIDDLEILTLEHRGVGASNRLSCPNEEAKTTGFNVVTCREEAKALYGDDLRHYTTTGAAKDLARAIELTRRDGVKAYVYGVSYGTMWAQRMMQVAPTVADAVILDSLVVVGQLFLSNFDPQADVVAQKIAELCKLDADCNAALGPDPWAKIVATKQKFVDGYCSQLGLAPGDRAFFTGLLRAHPLMPYALAVWQRIERCSDADVAAVKNLVKKIGQVFNGPNTRLNSDLIGMNIALSEMFEEPLPSQETITSRFDDTVFPSGVNQGYLSLQQWPRYPHDEHWGKLPEARVPVLVLNGTLDSQTPIEIAEKARAHFSAPGSTFVTVPNANHAVVNQSPMFASPGRTPPHCGMKLVAHFLKTPGSALDTSCTSQVLAPSFARPSDEIAFFLATDDLWFGALRTDPSLEPGSFLERLPRTVRIPAFPY
jgi:pimeloyl-ACP methyl ester carboxylesterase